MEETINILNDILEEIKYQTKLLETIVETKPVGNSDPSIHIEKVVSALDKMPLFKNISKGPIAEAVNNIAKETKGDN